MVSIFQQILDSLKDPHARHAMMVHVPIALGVLGVPLGLALLLTGARSTVLKLVVVACLLMTSAGAALAAQAGEDAEHKLEERGLTKIEHDAVHEHEELGEGGWVWPLIPAGLAALTLIPSKRRAIPLAAAGLATLASLGVAGWISATAHAGGRLVYEMGIGVPARAAPSATPAHEDH
ncbi:MAG: hypothetical protein FJ255_08745 [Phycisphaerae bacterium]|nr:hypothetical protein [Phycisphaerae bacterium]